MAALLTLQTAAARYRNTRKSRIHAPLHFVKPRIQLDETARGRTTIGGHHTSDQPFHSTYSDNWPGRLALPMATRCAADHRFDRLVAAHFIWVLLTSGRPLVVGEMMKYEGTSRMKSSKISAWTVDWIKQRTQNHSRTMGKFLLLDDRRTRPSKH